MAVTALSEPSTPLPLHRASVLVVRSGYADNRVAQPLLCRVAIKRLMPNDRLGEFLDGEWQRACAQPECVGQPSRGTTVQGRHNGGLPEELGYDQEMRGGNDDPPLLADFRESIVDLLLGDSTSLNPKYMSTGQVVVQR